MCIRDRSWYIGEDTTGGDMRHFSVTRRFIRQIDPWHPISASTTSGGRVWAYQYWIDFQQVESYSDNHPAGTGQTAMSMQCANEFLALGLAPGLGVSLYSHLEVALGAIYGVSGNLYFLEERGSPPQLLAIVNGYGLQPVSYTHLRAHETPEHLVCRLLLEKKNI
eukprot:TRINITY_DN48971_c0_g1_i1.p1 TRINITY_DN48971_c0_g1~~TRINITY_DN48971_c0_g1_i1.p1  ORF type:complete len:165 (+),score=47.10 TRINITY_DN48971_c0_g1_i1:123-617(+)